MISLFILTRRGEKSGLLLPAFFLGSDVNGDLTKFGGGSVRASGPERRSVDDKVAIWLDYKNVIAVADVGTVLALVSAPHR